MKVHFWGVRGSIPSPGSHTVRYGGNTPCLTVTLDQDHTLVLDAGTGLFRMGRQAPPGAHTYFFLFSHIHWDHIQGFPMFRPHMNPDVTIRILCSMNPDWSSRILSQLDGLYFPITQDELLANVSSYAGDINELLTPFDISLSWIRLNHRGECFGYRIQSSTGTLLYITDHEMDAEEHVFSTFSELASFCKGADVLIHDAQLTADELPAKAGWGHSAVERVCELAQRSDIPRIILIHHDPERSDDEIDGIVERANAGFLDAGVACECVAAYEGLEITF